MTSTKFPTSSTSAAARAVGLVIIGTITIQSIVRDIEGDTSDLMTVEMQSYEVTYTRADGGTRVPPPLVEKIFGSVGPGGTIVYDNLPILRSAQIDDASAVRSLPRERRLRQGDRRTVDPHERQHALLRAQHCRRGGRHRADSLHRRVRSVSEERATMRTHLRSKTILYLAATVLVLAFASCTTDSPTEPQQVPAPSGGGTTNPSTTWNITITSSRTQLEVGSDRSTTLTIRVRDSVNGALPPDGAVVTVTTTLGEFGVAGSGATSTTASTAARPAQVLLFPGDEEGTATVTARLESSFGQISIPIVVVPTIPDATPTPEPDVFFVERVEPDEGSPDGGDIVRILGQEFESPVRVTFGGLPADVLSVTSNAIRVRTPRNDAVPPPPAIGRLPVDVTVTINVNEVREATDTLASGFTYTRGDVGVQPVIFSVTPNIGPNEGGTRITINGDGFADPVQVTFEAGSSVLEAQVESVARTQIVVISPPAVGFGNDLRNQQVDIRVKNQLNGLEVVRTDAFRYGVAFSVFAVDPSSGPFTGGTRVTMFGEGFDEPLVVDFGDAPAAGAVGDRQRRSWCAPSRSVPSGACEDVDAAGAGHPSRDQPDGAGGSLHLSGRAVRARHHLDVAEHVVAEPRQVTINGTQLPPSRRGDLQRPAGDHRQRQPRRRSWAPSR